jgi:hypothetical protein
LESSRASRTSRTRSRARTPQSRRGRRARAGADAAAAAAADAAARNTEESREARELEATLVAHLHALGANGLWGAFEAPSSSVRETALATLAAWAAAHPSAVSRKAALQALHKIAQAWFPDDSRAGGIVASASPAFASSRPT